ncbi:MAG: hypothetical protein M1831_005641 [Alyxoria varia]|nr:MAG: hypothetical protein M1831_005641 [Alyxoria varia]
MSPITQAVQNRHSAQTQFDLGQLQTSSDVAQSGAIAALSQQLQRMSQVAPHISCENKPEPEDSEESPPSLRPQETSHPANATPCSGTIQYNRHPSSALYSTGGFRVCNRCAYFTIANPLMIKWTMRGTSPRRFRRRIEALIVEEPIHELHLPQTSPSKPRRYFCAFCNGVVQQDGQGMDKVYSYMFDTHETVFLLLKEGQESRAVPETKRKYFKNKSLATPRTSLVTLDTNQLPAMQFTLYASALLAGLTPLGVQGAPQAPSEPGCIVPLVLFTTLPNEFTISVIPKTTQPNIWDFELVPGQPSKKQRVHPVLTHGIVPGPKFTLKNTTLATAKGNFRGYVLPNPESFAPMLSKFVFGGKRPRDARDLELAAGYTCDAEGNSYLELRTEANDESFVVEKVGEQQQVFLKPRNFVGQAVDVSLKINGGQ